MMEKVFTCLGVVLIVLGIVTVVLALLNHWNRVC